jgi:exodeoxyribonuclease VII small subunit
MSNEMSLEKEIGELSFEEALKELEDTVGKLEAGDLILDESMALFERGQALAAVCNAQLEAATLKVEQLTPEGEIEDIS